MAHPMRVRGPPRVACASRGTDRLSARRMALEGADLAETSTTATEESIPALVRELKDLVVAYLRERTIDPLKGLVRYVLFGVAGSVALGAGLVLLAVALLRALQTELGGALSGSLSWLPYLITAAVALIVVAMAAAAALRGRKKRRK